MKQRFDRRKLVMTAELQADQKSLYETDFVRWVETVVAQLQAQDYASVDWGNLIEEIEEMSRRERKSLKSNLVVILLYLLKWQHQPAAAVSAAAFSNIADGSTMILKIRPA